MVKFKQRYINGRLQEVVEIGDSCYSLQDFIVEAHEILLKREFNRILDHCTDLNADIEVPQKEIIK